MNKIDMLLMKSSVFKIIANKDRKSFLQSLGQHANLNQFMISVRAIIEKLRRPEPNASFNESLAREYALELSRWQAKFGQGGQEALFSPSNLDYQELLSLLLKITDISRDGGGSVYLEAKSLFEHVSDYMSQHKSEPAPKPVAQKVEFAPIDPKDQERLNKFFANQSWFSPLKIDGKLGPNTKNALTWYKNTHLLYDASLKDVLDDLRKQVSIN